MTTSEEKISFKDLDAEPFEFQDDIPEQAEAYDEPDSSFIKKPRRAPNAVYYEKKVKKVFRDAFLLTAASPRTVADSAAILMEGPGIAEKAGDLAAQDNRVAKAIDMITQGSENPYLALVMSAAPLLFQLIRNHETDVQPTLKSLRIPFTKKTINFKWKFRLGKKVRNLTNDPRQLTDYVFSDPDIAEMIRKEDIKIAWKPKR